MKNQYFGDINDYRKYGLLRALSGMGAVRVAVCWMLNSGDGIKDGKLTQYLEQPEKWRHFDPDLYDQLRKRVQDLKMRHVSAAEEDGILPGAKFYADILDDNDNATARERYFENFWQAARGCELLFFDPDNGLEVKSRPYGRKGSSKYLYWRELEAGWQRGHSLLVYQHFPREKRDPFIERIARQMRERVGVPVVTSFRAGHVVFFLLPQPAHLEQIMPGVCAVRAVWSREMKVAEHPHA